MGKKIMFGGDRVGAGGKLNVELEEYGRSSHNMGFVWRSTMSAGTLVPFMNELALPGDTWDIDLDLNVMTHPTIGPMFGSCKVQMDIFYIPLRLYLPRLQMNMLDVGREMSLIRFPRIRVQGNNVNWAVGEIDNQQVNPSCILSYLGIRGLGYSVAPMVSRWFNAIPYLAYLEIYKNYYANKQEEKGAHIHRNPDLVVYGIVEGRVTDISSSGESLEIPLTDTGTGPSGRLQKSSTIQIKMNVLAKETDIEMVFIKVKPDLQAPRTMSVKELFKTWTKYEDNWIGTEPNIALLHTKAEWWFISYDNSQNETNTEPKISFWDLNNIDGYKMFIMGNIISPVVNITESWEAPIGEVLRYATRAGAEVPQYCATFNQEGLCVKTYQSDMFNNWLNKEWIDGDNGVNEVTAIDVSDGKLYLDDLIIHKKIFNMLQRIEVAGGTYDDYLDVTYTTKRDRSLDSPLYMGGASQELVFQEVVSNAESQGQPLGTLAGKGRLAGRLEGGKVVIRAQEAGYIMGIVSITPRLDYSQGNRFDVNLQNMDQLHKPALDEIGWQDAITDQFAWFDTDATDENNIIFKSAGKQPAWLNYRTNYNRCLGNFAEPSQQMYMTFNRKFEKNYEGPTSPNNGIGDLTTYIDPVKFNHIFADTRRDAQNYWTQIRVDATARRVMSARVIPNL